MSEQDTSDRYVFYHYTVSLPAAGIFLGLFLITTVYHLYQLFKTKRWNMVPFIIGGIMSFAGYGARIASHYDQWALVPYITQSLLLLVAPVLFAATIYMTLAGIIVTSVAEHVAKVRSFEQTTQPLRGVPSTGYTTLHGDDNAVPEVTASDIAAASRSTVFKIPVIWITRIFVVADVVALFTQGGGGGLLAKGNPTGEKIVLAGLFIQIVAFTFFLVMAIAFHMKQRRDPFRSSLSGARNAQKVEGWKKMLYALYTASVLLLVRNTFRVIEYIQGQDGYLLRNEIWLYIFDAVLMFALMVLLNVIHPGEVLVGDAYHLAKKMERKRKRAGGSGEPYEMEGGQGQGWGRAN